MWSVCACDKWNNIFTSAHFILPQMLMLQPTKYDSDRLCWIHLFNLLFFYFLCFLFVSIHFFPFHFVSFRSFSFFSGVLMLVVFELTIDWSLTNAAKVYVKHSIGYEFSVVLLLKKIFTGRKWWSAWSLKHETRNH